VPLSPGMTRRLPGRQPVNADGCLAEGCERVVMCRSLCTQHYQRQKRLGTLDPPTRNPIAEFWSRSEPQGECLIRTGCTTPDGYGRLAVAGVDTYAHRYAYQLTYGSVPDGLVIDHLCRNPSCVQPAHLQAVTYQVNTLRGRHSHLKRRDTCGCAICEPVLHRLDLRTTA